MDTLDQVIAFIALIAWGLWLVGRPLPPETPSRRPIWKDDIG